MAQFSNECQNCGGTFHMFQTLEGTPSSPLLRYRSVRGYFEAYKSGDPTYRNYGVCQYCKWVGQPLVKQSFTEKYQEAFMRRLNYQFQSAVEVYRDIIAQDQSEFEAYWLRALSTHKIADDNELYYFSPPHATPLLDDEDFKKACEWARISSPQKLSYYEQEAKRLDGIRSAYHAVEKQGKNYQVCVCATPDYAQTAARLSNLIAEKRSDVNCFVTDLSQANNEAEVCYAVHSADVMVLVGDERSLQGKMRSRYWKPFSLRDNVQLIVATNDEIGDQDLIENAHIKPLSSEEWLELAMEKVEDKFPQQGTTVVNTGPVTNNVNYHTINNVNIGDINVSGSNNNVNINVGNTITITNSYETFKNHNFKEAYSAAQEFLQSQPKSVPARFISAFYLAVVQNTTHRDALKKFFYDYGGMTMNAEDAERLKNLFLSVTSKLMPYEEAAVRMIMNSELDAKNVSAFAEAFCSKLVSLQTSRSFLTSDLQQLYCELAEEYTMQKLCLALLSATRTNPDSPIPKNQFFMEAKVEAFRREYFQPIGQVINSMKDEALCRKFQAVYRNELAKYDQSARDAQ